MSGNKYRKKPVMIEAEQFFPDKKPWPEGVTAYAFDRSDRLGCSIQTPEGPFVVSPGDFIITGIMGEKYPCKASIFELTYEKVES